VVLHSLCYYSQFDDLFVASYTYVPHILLVMWLLPLSDIGLVPTVQQLSYAGGGGIGH